MVLETYADSNAVLAHAANVGELLMKSLHNARVLFSEREVSICIPINCLAVISTISGFFIFVCMTIDFLIYFLQHQFEDLF
jgi:hypothetical protein